MPRIFLGYGQKEEAVDISEANLIGILRPRIGQTVSRGEESVKAAMTQPIGSGRLKEIVEKGDRVAVVISDITRPCPTSLLLPPVLDELNEGGVPDENIIVVSALGSHRPHTKEEMKRLVGKTYERVKCIDSWGKDYVEVGTSTRGTPYQVLRQVAQADKRVCLGNIDYHYFAGYSGGAKAIVPGVCTRRTIQANHRMMLESGAKVGTIMGNPVREDIEEIVSFLSIDFIVNAVLDENKNIMAVVTGHFQEAHREGCRILDQAYRLPITQLADIVITSPHGFPKDINMYQAQKALDNAQWAAKPGGIIILVAECREGLGEETFARWLEEAKQPQDLLDRIAVDFQLGGHKAAAVASIVSRFQVFLVSGLPEKTVSKLYMRSFSHVNDALREALDQKGPDAKIWLMPTGGTTLPQLI